MMFERWEHVIPDTSLLLLVIMKARSRYIKQCQTDYRYMYKAWYSSKMTGSELRTTTMLLEMEKNDTFAKGGLGTVIMRTPV